MNNPTNEFFSALFTGIAGIITSLVGSTMTALVESFFTPLVEALAAALGLSSSM